MSPKSFSTRYEPSRLLGVSKLSVPDNEPGRVHAGWSKYGGKQPSVPPWE